MCFFKGFYLSLCSHSHVIVEAATLSAPALVRRERQWSQKITLMNDCNATASPLIAGHFHLQAPTVPSSINITLKGLQACLILLCLNCCSNCGESKCHFMTCNYNTKFLYPNNVKCRKFYIHPV